METIDKIRLYLERGYQFTVQKDSGKERYLGTLLLMDNPYSIRDLVEVEVNSVIKSFPNICEELDKVNQTLSIVYDSDSWNIKSMIQQKTFHGPYAEKTSYEVVEDYVENGANVMESFFLLDENIMNGRKTLIKKVSSK